MKSRGTLRINRVIVRKLEAPLIQPFRIATGTHAKLENLFIRIDAGALSGYGEAAIATHITGETIAGTGRALATIGRALIGRDAGDYRILAGEAAELAGEHKAALAAVETALLDLVARSLEIPLWRLFGPRAHPVRTDVTIVIGDLAESEDAIRRFGRMGFSLFKVKVGRDHDLDLERIFLVRKLMPKAGIIIDANQVFTASSALRFLSALQRRGIRPLLVEQPVPKDDIDGLAKLTRASKAPICADESSRSLVDAARLIRLGAVDVINIKIMKCGILEAREIAYLASAKGVGLMIGSMMESSLAATAAAHLAAGLGLFTFVDLDTPFFVANGLCPNPYVSRSGVYRLASVPAGIGVRPAFR